MCEDIRDTHVQNVNRNALKVAIECERARACERTLERSGHKCNKENGIEKERKHDKDDNQKIQRKKQAENWKSKFYCRCNPCRYRYFFSI